MLKRSLYPILRVSRKANAIQTISGGKISRAFYSKIFDCSFLFEFILSFYLFLSFQAAIAKSNSMKSRESLIPKSAFFVPSLRKKLLTIVAFALVVNPVNSASEADVSSVVESAISEITYMLENDFPTEQVYVGIEAMFDAYADTDYIGKISLGRPWLDMTTNQKKLYIKEFQGYLSRKYINYFPRFIGGDYEVISITTNETNNSFEVVTQMNLSHRPPFPVYWYLNTINDEPRIQNIIVDDLNLLALEKKIISVLWEKSRGNVRTLIGTVANR